MLQRVVRAKLFFLCELHASQNSTSLRDMGYPTLTHPLYLAKFLKTQEIRNNFSEKIG